MASGAVGAEEQREKHKWSENSKVYSRKIRRKINDNSNENATATATSNQETTAGVVENGKGKDVSEKSEIGRENNGSATPAVDGGDAVAPPPDSIASPAKEVDSQPDSQSGTAKDVESEPRQLVSQSSPAKEADSETRQPVSQTSPAMDVDSQPVLLPDSQSSPAKEADSETRQPVSQTSPAMDVDSQPVSQPNSHSSPAKEVGLETRQPVSPVVQASPAKGLDSQPDLGNEVVEVVCDDDSSSLNRQEGEVMNGNGAAPVRPVVTRVGDRVSISLSAATSKEEARDLKRKLLSDLDQVRSLAKRLDTKEAQVYNGGMTSSADVGAGGIVTSVVGQSLSQYSTSEGLGKGGGVLRANSEGVSAGLNDPRPFRRLSVSVMDISRSGGGGNEIVEKEKRTPKANQYYQSSDFICGKEKLPPAESNKKHKSSGRKKHGAGGSEFDKHIFKKCGSLLQQLMKHKFSWVFNTPVDVKGLCLHDYYDIIKHPMDLGTVKNRLGKNWYKSPSEFAEDVRLTFSNAMTYNPEGQDVHVMAVEMSNTFEQKWAEIEAEYNSKLRYEAAYDMGLPTPTSRLAPLPFYVPPQPTTPVPRPAYQETRHLDRSESFALPVESRMKPVYSAPVGRTAAPKKPKAKDPNKRNMTFEEKTRLSTNLQALPSEKLDSIVQIITKRNPSLCQHDEEVEVDIDSVDAETLWELDRFVTNYKKTLSKHKRKAELALQRAQTQQQTVQPTNPAPHGPDDPNKETTPDNPNAAAGSTPVRDGKQAENGSGSSSSSSSSSDSGSSSSDSDSDSSSGSGSDGGE